MQIGSRRQSGCHTKGAIRPGCKQASKPRTFVGLDDDGIARGGADQIIYLGLTASVGRTNGTSLSQNPEDGQDGFLPIWTISPEIGLSWLKLVPFVGRTNGTSLRQESALSSQSVITLLLLKPRSPWHFQESLFSSVSARLARYQLYMVR